MLTLSKCLPLFLIIKMDRKDRLIEENFDQMSVGQTNTNRNLDFIPLRILVSYNDRFQAQGIKEIAFLAS